MFWINLYCCESKYVFWFKQHVLSQSRGYSWYAFLMFFWLGKLLDSKTVFRFKVTNLIQVACFDSKFDSSCICSKVTNLIQFVGFDSMTVFRFKDGGILGIIKLLDLGRKKGHFWRGILLLYSSRIKFIKNQCHQGHNWNSVVAWGCSSFRMLNLWRNCTKWLAF